MKKILVVDDHVAVRAGIAWLLQVELAGSEPMIVQAADGMEALRVLSDGAEWHLVLLDLNMPGLSGSETLLRIRRARPRLPVLVVSAYADRRYALQMQEAGARGYLDKGFAAADLVNAVKVLLDGGSWFKSGGGRNAPAPATALNAAEDLRSVGLTARQFEVFSCMCRGLDRTAIAVALGMSTSAVSKARAAIRAKLQVTRNADVIKYAVKAGLLDDQHLHSHPHPQPVADSSGTVAQ